MNHLLQVEIFLVFETMVGRVELLKDVLKSGLVSLPGLFFSECLHSYLLVYYYGPVFHQ